VDVLHVSDTRLPMAYRGLRNISLAFATTLRIRGGQNDLQIRPHAILRDKKTERQGH
jgi:hypothetical protein